ncbi:hypothetical protein [Chiayiivirga flava]|uniref:Argininosuccinate lyase n=1 Tax=Chiayiivirga flava TaxID=659595 RepID=A0A7W8G0K1_9GAMM|nr:hypothetical protein [Chiayiivirga flava]MBB5208419.1 hypothetical protein [Chiayiivirga flava]
MRTVLLALSLFALPAVSHAYSFTITNSSSSRITGVEVSEDGRSWGYFDIGRGIPAGTSTEVVWDSSTDDSGCEWQVRATFADESVSDPTSFDFCEEDLEIEFDD